MRTPVVWNPPCDPSRPCRCFGGATPEQVRARRDRLGEESQRLAFEVDRLRRALRAKDAEIARLKERVDVVHLEVRRALGTAIAEDEEEGGQSPPSPPPRRGGCEAGQPPRKRGPRFGHHGVSRPRPEHIDRVVETAPAACPHCGSQALGACGPAYSHVQEDIVPAHREVTRYHHQPVRCQACGEVVDPLGPDEIPGSALFGPRMRATAIFLRYQVGVSYDHVADIFKHLAGLHVSAGALVEIGRHATRRAEALYADLCQRLRASAVVYSDATGWRSDGLRYHLWSHSNTELVVQHIDPRAGHEVVERFLGKPFGGTLVTDCGSAYSPVEALGGKQKCHAHLARSARELRETAADEPEVAAFAEALLAFSKRACELDAERKARGLRQWPVAEALEHEADLKTQLDALFAVQSSHPDVQRLQGRLRRHRDEWWTFLWRPGVEATNNLAERDLRPSVIVRKITHGNRSREGMHCHSVLTSILATAARRGQALVDFLVSVLTQPPEVVREALFAPP